MPAKSKAQQRFMGMVRATQKGEMKDPSPAVAKAADSISDTDAEHYAATKTEGLPEHAEKKENKEAAAHGFLDGYMHRG